MATVLTAPGTSVSGDADVPADASIDQLIDAYRRPAFNLAYRLVRRPEDAADAVQDAFVLAMRATRRSSAAPREPSRFGSWLLKIVANVALAQLRRRRAATSVSLDALGIDLADGHDDQPLATVVRREQRGDVLQALLALPDAQRAALTLRGYQGLNYDEIGELLGLDRAAIAALLYRARAGFRAAYEGVAASPRSAGCSRLAPLISAMLDAELEPGTWKRVDQHVAGCGRCRRELKQLRRGQRLHEIIPILTPPASLSAASALGAAGATGAAGVVGVVTRSPALRGVIGRAAELARPLATAPWLGAAALPGGAEGGLSTVVERGIGKLAGLATAAGLLVALAAGSPAHHRIADPVSLSTPAVAERAANGADRAANAAPEASPTSPASGAAQDQGPVSAQPPVLALSPTASDEGTLASGPAAGEQIAPAARPELTLAGAAGEDAAQAVVAGGEVSARASENGSSSAPSEVVAQVAGPGAGGPAPGAPQAAGPPSNEPPTGPASSAASAGSSGAGGSEEPAAGGISGPGTPSGPSASLDLPSIAVAVAGVPPIDLPAVSVPPVELSAVAAGTVDLPPVELPAVDVPPVELPAVSLPVGNRSSLDLPARDPPAVNVPAVDLPPVELPLTEAPIVGESLDRARGVAGQALAEGERLSKPLTGLGDQVEQAIPGAVVAVPDVVRTPASNTTNRRAGGGPESSPGIGVGSGQPAEPAASVTVSSGATGTGQAASSPVDLSATAGAGPANTMQRESPSLTVHADVNAGAAGASSSGVASLVESSVNLDAGSSGVIANVDVGSSSAGSNESNSGSSVAVSVDTGSSSASSSDNGSSSAGVSVSASVDTGSVSSSNNESNSASSVSVSVNVSVDTNASGSTGNESSSNNSGVSISVGNASVSVSLP